MNPYFILILVVSAGICILRTSHKRQITYKNFQNLAIILTTQIKRPFLGLNFFIKVDGFYKGRKLGCYYAGSGTLHFHITPNVDLPKEKLLILKHQEPTEKTFVDGKNIALKNTLFFFSKERTIEEIKARLNELTEAAEMVEKAKN